MIFVRISPVEFMNVKRDAEQCSHFSVNEERLERALGSSPRFVRLCPFLFAPHLIGL